MGKIISVANRKGGVGKTSAAIFLATALAKKNKKVLYIDCDSQASAYEYRQFEKKNVYDEETKEPYRIIALNPNYLFNEIERYKNEHDIVFIDLPRFTHGKNDSNTTAILAICDYILIPAKPGELDNLSTLTFIKMLKEIRDYKKEKGQEYHFAAFISLSGQRPTDDENTKTFVKSLEIPYLQHELKNLREFSYPQTFESLLDEKKSAKKFEPFYKEVLDFINE